MHGGASPVVKAKALERLKAARDLALERFAEQLGANIVDPRTTLAGARDLTRVVHEVEEREQLSTTASVLDDWLASLRNDKDDTAPEDEQ